MARSKVQQPDVIDVPATNEDEQFVVPAGDAVKAFLGGVRQFFAVAKGYETAAKDTLAKARGLTLPTNSDEDVAIQGFIKATSVDKKIVEEHWNICQVVHGFHKRLTAARQRPVAMIEEANAIGNRLHNAYVENERRRASQEQERVRQEAERRAAEDRQRELDAAEAAAVKAEEASTDLSEREQTFVEIYFASGNGQRAASVAGYKDALKTAARLLLLPVFFSVFLGHMLTIISQNKPCFAKHPGYIIGHLSSLLL